MQGPPATPSRVSSTTASNRTVDFYGRTLEWVLRHEMLTLLVLAATMVATFWLYSPFPRASCRSRTPG